MKKIYIELENIRKKLKLIQEQINEANTIEDYTERNEILIPLYEEEKTLHIKKMLLEEELSLSMPPVKSNDLINLRLKSIDYPNTYLIRLHNTKTIIGEISFRGYHTSEYIGDIGYWILPEFQGNNYAYEALVLLSEKLYEDGIPDFWVGINIDNIASIKTIEKYGGKIIKNNGGTLLFQCETQKIKNTKESKK